MRRSRLLPGPTQDAPLVGPAVAKNLSVTAGLKPKLSIYHSTFDAHKRLRR
jgi:hypothetical protein